MGGAAVSKSRKNYATAITVGGDLEVFGPTTAAPDANPERPQRRHTIQDVKAQLCDAGLRPDEVDAALSQVARNVIMQDASAGRGAQGAAAIRQASASRAIQEGGLVDASEILGAIEERRGFLPKALRANLNKKSEFSTWMDRCQNIMEEEDEANFLAKKQLAAQVRAYLANCSEAQGTDAVRHRVGSLLGDHDKADNDECGEDAPSDEDSSDGSEGIWVHRMASVKSISAVVKSERRQGLEMSADDLYQKLLARKSRMPISKKYVNKLLDKFATCWIDKYGRSPPLLQDLCVPKRGRTIVVGDTHGQLQDVLTIFLTHGTPSTRNRYIFNGDIADRGPNAVEIFSLLFAFFVEDHDSVVITRGNHEDEEMNALGADEGGGFQDEILRKYTGAMMTKFEKIYKLLPIAAVVQEELFIVHGGLGRNCKTNLSLQFISNIDCSQVSCPHGGGYPLSLDQQVFQDMLWSDPHEKLGWEPNPRGAGIKWGPDLTASFLRRTGLKWIIRSHQLPEGRSGWSSHHLGLVYTLFSASNYCGTSQNKGAVCVLELKETALGPDDSKLSAKFVEHYAPALGTSTLLDISKLSTAAERWAALEEAGMARASEDEVKVGRRQEQAVLAKMAGRIVEFRPELWSYFRSCDEARNGQVVFEQWCEVLTSVCGEHLPWALGGDIWEICDSEGQVDYVRFLRRFEVGVSKEKWMGWKSVLMRDVYEALYCRDSDLKQTFALFDPEGKGRVDMDTFVLVLQEQVLGSGTTPQQHLLSESQLQCLAQGLFPPAVDGQVPNLSIHEFFQRFTVIHHQSQSMTGDDALFEWRPTLAKIGHLILKEESSAVGRCTSVRHSITDRKSMPERKSFAERKSFFLPAQQLTQQFEKGDVSGNGLLSIDEFVEFIQHLDGIDSVTHKGRVLTDEDIVELAVKLDLLSGAQTNQVNLLSFLEAFMVERSAGHDLDSAENFICEQVLSFLYRHRHAVCCGCHNADPGLTGRVSVATFADVLRGIDVSLGKRRRTFTDLQIDGLTDLLGEEDGSFSYFDLLQALVVHDAERPAATPTSHASSSSFFG
eukprot:TRINITY_DN20111_c0_g1_i1.p1 TRINITY_DN20111_c0_g1~~TRINITY_DN20111_c0_g1_i1.p1  ORF type:complete len:1059 (+),score=182.29 TRINITY_DN20111_c0_g1_i1:82-3258(+)